jgi:hypothetical protein
MGPEAPHAANGRETDADAQHAEALGRHFRHRELHAAGVENLARQFLAL